MAVSQQLPVEVPEVFQKILQQFLEHFWAAADDGLPAFHRQGTGTRGQGNLLQLVAPVGKVGRQIVVFAVVGIGSLIEGFE